MRKFLYLCLLGTALVSAESVFAGRVAGDGLTEVEKSSYRTSATGGSIYNLLDGDGTVVGTKTVKYYWNNGERRIDTTYNLTDAGKTKSWTVTDSGLKKTSSVVPVADATPAAAPEKTPAVSDGWESLSESDRAAIENGGIEGVDFNKTPAAAPDTKSLGSDSYDRFVETELNKNSWESRLQSEDVYGMHSSDSSIKDVAIGTDPKGNAYSSATFNDGTKKVAFESGLIQTTDKNGVTTIEFESGAKYKVQKNGDWTGVDAKGNKISGYTKDGKFVQGERITHETLSDGSVKRFDNATGNALVTKNGATNVLGKDGVSTNSWVSNKTGKTIAGLETGSPLNGGSYSSAGEVYNSGTLGMGKTQVYKNNETGQYFTTSNIDSKTGQATVESAFRNSGTTVGEYNIQYDPTKGQALMIGKDGKSFTNFTTEVVGDGEGFSVKFDTKTGKFTDQFDNVYTYDAKNKQFNMTEKAPDSDLAPEGPIKQNENMDKAIKEADEAKAAAAAASKLPDKAVTQNAVEYGIVIAEAVVGNEKTELTKNTTVEGADQVVEAQGTTHESKIVAATKDDALSATTISSAANVMIALLQANPLDLTLLDDNACDTGTGSAGQGTTTAGAAIGGIDTTAYKKCIKNKRALFAQTVAAASQVIAEGSNAISARFYDRVTQLMDQANGQYVSEFADAHGSLGAISVVNDAERYPYFEMVRGAALSAVQLTAKGAENLVEVDVEIKPQEKKKGEGE